MERIPLEILKINVPKYCVGELQIRNDYYIVQDGLFYCYFPIKTKSIPGFEHHFVIEKAPPILIEGWAVVDGVMYAVTFKDLQRQIIRKYRKINLGRRNESGSANDTTGGDLQSANTTAPGLSAGATTIVQSEYESTISTPSGLEGCEGVDATYKEQMRTLLNLISEKEGGEWEITDIAQPRLINAGHAVSNP